MKACLYRASPRGGAGECGNNGPDEVGGAPMRRSFLFSILTKEGIAQLCTLMNLICKVKERIISIDYAVYGQLRIMANNQSAKLLKIQ